MRSGNQEICQLLLEHGADTKLKDSSGQDVSARMENRAEILQTIQSHRLKRKKAKSKT